MSLQYEFLTNQFDGSSALLACPLLTADTDRKGSGDKQFQEEGNAVGKSRRPSATSESESSTSAASSDQRDGVLLCNVSQEQT